MSYRLDIWNQMLLIEKRDVTSLEWTNWKFLFLLKYHPLHKMHHPIGSIANRPHPSFFARQEHGSKNQRERVSCALRVIKGFAYRKLPSWICLCGSVSFDSKDIMVVEGLFLSGWTELESACSCGIFCHL